MRMMAAFAVLGLLLLYVWERVDLVRLGYSVQQLEAKHRVLEREHDELKVRASTLTAPERIARVATERLGMVRPEQGQVVLVKLDGASPSQPPPLTGEVRLAKNDLIKRKP